MSKNGAASAESAKKTDQHPQGQESKSGGNDQVDHHRFESKAYSLLVVWILGDALVVFDRQHLGVFCLGLAIFLGMGLALYHAQKGWPKIARCLWWLHAICLPVVVAILFLVSRNPTGNLSFLVNSPVQFVSGRDDIPEFWIENDGVVFPAQIVMDLQLTSLSGDSFMIDEYSIANKGADGEWHTVPRVPGNAGHWIMGTALDWRRVDAPGHIFDEMVRDRNIAPKESFHGWVAFELPDAEVGDQWKMHVRDTRGRVFEQLLTLRVPPPGSPQCPAFIIGTNFDILSCSKHFFNRNEAIIVDFVTNGQNRAVPAQIRALRQSH